MGTDEVGGLVGVNRLTHTKKAAYGSITECCAKGRVFGNCYIGGLVGYNKAQISQCYAEADVEGNSTIGGFAGNNFGSITNCYAKSIVNGKEVGRTFGLGGLTGYNSGTISNCYAKGRDNGKGRVRGLVGESESFSSFRDVKVSDSFWDMGSTGKTTTEMQDPKTFTDAGWDFSSIWDMPDDEGYPILQKVDINTFEAIKLDAIENMGKLVAKVGQSSKSKDSLVINCNGKVFYYITGLAFWVLFVLSLVLVESNRNGKVLYILIPMLTVNLLIIMLVFFLQQVIRVASSQMMLDMSFLSLSSGITGLWLLGEKISRLNSCSSLILALVVMVGFGTMKMISYTGIESSGETFTGAVILGVMIVALLSGLSLSSISCRSKYSPNRFMLWLAVWTIAMCVLTLIVYSALQMILGQIPIEGIVEFGSIIGQAIIVGIVLSLCIYLIVLPYMALALQSPFFRVRPQKLLSGFVPNAVNR